MFPQEEARKKPHVVCIPFPSQGHVTPSMQLAKLLHSRGLHITFLKPSTTTTVKGLPDFWFETIPDGLPPSDKDGTLHPPMLCYSVRKNCQDPFWELLVNLNSTGEVLPVSCVISEVDMNFGMKAAMELGIPTVELWTASACSFPGYLSFRDLIKRGILPFKDEKSLSDGTLDAPMRVMLGLKNMRMKDILNFIKLKAPKQDIMNDFMGEQAHECLESSKIIIYTFDALEQESLDVIGSMFSGDMYTVGPLAVLIQHISMKSHHGY